MSNFYTKNEYKNKQHSTRIARACPPFFPRNSSDDPTSSSLRLQISLNQLETTRLRWMGMLLYDDYVFYFLISLLMNTPCSLSVGIRRSAFEKLAALAVKQPQGNESDLSRLSQQTRPARQADGTLNGVLKDQSPTSRVPMVRIRNSRATACDLVGDVN